MSAALQRRQPLRQPKTPPPPPKRSRSWLGLAFKLLLAFTAIAFVLGIYLDAKVRERMESQSWALPALIYSRPLELQPLMRLSAQQLEQELELLGYKAVAHPQKAGEYQRQGDRVTFVRRPFSFYDRDEAARAYRAQFSGPQLQTLSAVDNGFPIPAARLDPVLLDRLSNSEREDRILVRLKEAPDELIVALLATEDREFYQHRGVSLIGTLRALVVNVMAGRKVQGGSTITQQLAKNLLLTSERSLWRKIKELFFALIIDYRYSKDQILEAYLNEVYLGQNYAKGVYGFGLASYFYFGIPISELAPEQTALLVALVKGASYYDPWRNPQRALERRNLVLRLLHEHGSLTPEQYQLAVAKPLTVIPRGKMSYGRAPAFMALLKRQIGAEFGNELLNESGLRIFTTLEPLAQRAAEQAVSQGLSRIEKQLNKKQLEAALVISDWHNGEITALVGGRDPTYAGFNRALDAKRQIGSLVKPPVYLTGLARGMTLATPLEDNPITLKMPDGALWSPQNYDREFRGQVPLAQALANSLNVPTVNLGLTVGLEQVVNTLNAMGVNQKIEPYPSLVLGAIPLSPLEVNQLYLPIAHQGASRPLTTLRAILTQDGRRIRLEQPNFTQVVDAAASQQTLYAMTQTVAQGTARSLLRTFPNLVMAGKTGTTNELRDSWFAGIDQSELTTIWVGRDDNVSAGLTGANGALSLYRNYLLERGTHSLQIAP